MDSLLIRAINQAVPDVDVYHDFAPEEAEFPLVIVQRVGGAGNLFINPMEEDGYEVRFSVSVWDVDRLGAVAKSIEIEKSVLSSLEAYAVSAAESVVLDDDRRGMVQDFVITA